MVVRGPRGRNKMGRWGIRGLKMRAGWECCIGIGGLDCTVKIYMLEESEKKATVLRVGTEQGGQLQE